MSYGPPPEALMTPCILGCKSRIMWEYEPGELQTYWYPGSPDYFTAVKGCVERHLERSTNDNDEYKTVIGELYRQLLQWELLQQASFMNQRSSRCYLGVPKRYGGIAYDHMKWEDL